MVAADPISRVFSALADPTRRAILDLLSGGELTVSEIAAPFAISLPAISRHLKVLEQAGLISRGRQAQWRTSALRLEPLEEATGWIEDLTKVWDDRFDRLDAHLESMKRRLATQGAAAANESDPTEPQLMTSDSATDPDSKDDPDD